LSETVVCVTGAGGPAGFNCIRSLRESEIDPKIVALDMDGLAAGLFHGADASYVVPPARDEGFVLTLCRIIEREEVDVLIPTVDEEIRALCIGHNLERIGETASFLLPDQDTASKALDKSETLLACEAEGLPIPETAVATDIGGAAARADDLGYPVVVKPSGSRGARGVSLVEGEGDLEAAFRGAEAEGGRTLIQEYVPGPVYTVGTVLDRSSEVAASIVLRKVKQVPPMGGVAVAGKTVQDPEMMELGERYVSCLGWVGPASPEIKRDERDGSLKLMEVNPRLFGYNYLATAAGMNLSEITVRLALGEKLEPTREYREGLCFVRTPFDILVDDEVCDR